MNRVLKTSLATLTALGTALALTGCAGIIEAGADRVGDAVQDQIKDNIGVDVQFGDNASLPDGFPESIPQPDGRIVGAVGLADGWSVSYELTGPTGIDRMLDDLASQGYTVEQDRDQDGGRLVILKGDDYGVAIVLIVESDKALAQVTVTPAGE